MTKSQVIVCGDGDSAATIQYLHGRGVLRLTSGREGETRELSLTQFCEELGIGREALRPTTYYLFACRKGAPSGGYRDLVATFDCPVDARREFVAWRRNPDCTWAEVISVSDGKIAALCWFGVDRVDRPLPPRTAPVTPARPRRWRRARSAQPSSRA